MPHYLDHVRSGCNDGAMATVRWPESRDRKKQQQTVQRLDASFVYITPLVYITPEPAGNKRSQTSGHRWVLDRSTGGLTYRKRRHYLVSRCISRANGGSWVKIAAAQTATAKGLWRQCQNFDSSALPKVAGDCRKRQVNARKHVASGSTTTESLRMLSLIPPLPAARASKWSHRANIHGL